MMWTSVAEQITGVTGQQFKVEQRQAVSGGSINHAFAISDRQQTYFVKLNQAAKVAMFEAEALALKEIAQTATLRVPQVITWGIASESSYLVLEWVELDRGRHHDWDKLGHQLAALHRATSRNGFGWHQANTIGETPQLNPWTATWAEFFTQHRIAYQLQLAERRGGHFPRHKELLEAIPRLLANHQPQPSLVHGDLWSGNAAFTATGEPIIFDPAVYFGDREVDLAMTELFGGFPPAFYQAYNQVFPLAPGYAQRKTLYNLYHILNHFSLFGGSYSAQANSMIDQLLGLF